MLNCREVSGQADALLARELTWGRRWSMQLHLAMCRHCRRYVRQFAYLQRAIPHMHGPATAAEVAEVMRHIRHPT